MSTFACPGPARLQRFHRPGAAVGDPTTGKDRVHLDLTAPDLDAEVDRLVSGAQRWWAPRRRSRWAALADPQGTQFCVAGEQDASAGP